MIERVQKFIAATGYLSRRNAEEAILQGRVTVNGVKLSELGTKVGPGDEVRVDGKLLVRPVTSRTVLLNKPPQVMTTKSDPEGRKTVMQLLPETYQTLKPVGRLDFDSEGLIVLTEDGDLANRIAHPSHGIQKIYQVWVRSYPSSQTLKKLTDSVELKDGPGRFEKVTVIRTPQGGAGDSVKIIPVNRATAAANVAQLEVTVSEGRNRFIRRMMEEVGHPVVRLLRVQVGGLKLGALKAGEFRELKQQDLEQIFLKV